MSDSNGPAIIIAASLISFTIIMMFGDFSFVGQWITDIENIDPQPIYDLVNKYWWVIAILLVSMIYVMDMSRYMDVLHRYDMTISENPYRPPITRYVIKTYKCVYEMMKDLEIKDRIEDRIMRR